MHSAVHTTSHSWRKKTTTSDLLPHGDGSIILWGQFSVDSSGGAAGIDTRFTKGAFGNSVKCLEMTKRRSAERLWR